MASVRPCVGRTLPVESGIQSIWFLKTAVCCQWGVSYLISKGHRGRVYQIAVLLGAHPDVAVAPLAEFAELLDFWVIVLLVVFDWQA